MVYRSLFIFILSLVAVFNSSAISRSETATKQRDKGRFQVEAFDEYQFNLCDKYAKENDNYYIYKCDEDKTVESSLSNLEYNQYRISKKIYSDHFLKDLQSFTLNSLKKNEEDISSLIDCIDSEAIECNEKIKSVKEYIRAKLPSYRKTVALANLQKQSGRGFTFYNISKDIEHDSLDYEMPELSDKEFSEVGRLKDEITYNLKQDALSQLDHKCITYDYEYRSSQCPRYIRNKSQSIQNKGIERVKEQYQNEYYKRTDADNLIARVNLRGDESDEVILKELKKQLTESVQANRKAYNKILNLTEDDDLIDLVKNQSAVQGFLQTQNISKASCDVAQSLFEEVESDKLMTSLYLGGAAIVGGGICLGTFGIGCAIGVGVAAEAVDLYMQQSNLNDSRLSYSAGLGSVESIESAESDRNLALAFVAVGSVGHLAKPTIKLAKSGYTAARKTTSNVLEANPPSIHLSEMRRYRPVLSKNYSSSKSLKDKYADYSLTSPKVNKRWIDNANSSDASLYLDVENAALKRLNDSLGDKELVTSLTNLHKDVLYDRINKLTKKYDGIEFEVYSDFKSLRFAFTPKNIPDDIKNKLLKDLNITYKKANEDFADMIKGMDGIGKESPSTWFEGGFASTADGAGQAAKRARNIKRSGPELVSYSDIKKSVEDDLNSIQSYSSTLRESPLYNANLVDEIAGGGRTVKLSVIETVRKSVGKHTPEEVKRVLASEKSMVSNTDSAQIIDSRAVQNALKDKFGVSLSEDESRGLVKYIAQLDGLTPGLRQEARTNASLDRAVSGGFSGDVTGMGARNIQQVANDLAGAKSLSSEDVLRVTRAGEQDVTKTFNNIKDNFTSTVRSVFQKRKIEYDSKCSGDDCIVIPTSKLTADDEIAVVDAFRKQANPSQYRLSFIPPNIYSGKRTLLATHGELMEKELRKQITGVSSDRIAYEKLSKITMGTRMPSSVNSGDVELYLGLGKGINLNQAEKKLIETAYKKAVININRDLANEASDSASFLYSSGGVKFID